QSWKSCFVINPPPYDTTNMAPSRGALLAKRARSAHAPILARPRLRSAHDCRRRRRRSIRRIPWPSQGPVRVLLHRDVGALLVLRDEGAAAAVPGEVPPV